MPAHFCPVCVRRLVFHVCQAGKRVKCPHCEAHLTLPLRTSIENETLDGLGLPPRERRLAPLDSRRHVKDLKA